MITSAWPYILRVALALYYVYAHLPVLLAGFKNIALQKSSLFSCVSSYIPTEVSFTLWHGAFLLLAVLIVLWPRPLVFLCISFFILLATGYIGFAGTNNPANLLTIICLLLNLALIIIYAKRRY